MGVIKNIHRFEDGEEQKLCGQCGEYKPLTGFYRNHKSWDGLVSCCKECCKKNMKRWNSKNYVHGRVRGPSYKHVRLLYGIEGKLCGKCREIKPLSAFNKEKAHWDGLKSICRKCQSVYDTNYHLKKQQQNIVINQ